MVQQGEIGASDSVLQKLYHKFFCVRMYYNNRGRGGGRTGGVYGIPKFAIVLHCSANVRPSATKYNGERLFLIVLKKNNEKQCATMVCKLHLIAQK